MKKCLYHLYLLNSPKDYVQILDGIIPTKKKFGLFKAYIRY